MAVVLFWTKTASAKSVTIKRAEQIGGFFMRTKFGTALDIFILIIGPWILYTRVVEIANNGVSAYPVISLLVVSLAVILSVYNLYSLFASRNNNQ
jgi:hypothetical protein